MEASESENRTEEYYILARSSDSSQCSGISSNWVYIYIYCKHTFRKRVRMQKGNMYEQRIAQKQLQNVGTNIKCKNPFYSARTE